MSTTTWSSLGTTQSPLTTELNSLATATMSSLSSEIDNTSGKDMFADFQLDVTYGTNPSVGGYVAVYCVQALDGTNYATSASGYTSHLLCSFPLRAVTTEQIITARNIMLPPTKFKLAAYNAAGQTTAASGNTVKYRTYNMVTA